MVRYSEVFFSRVFFSDEKWMMMRLKDTNLCISLYILLLLFEYEQWAMSDEYKAISNSIIYSFESHVLVGSKRIW